MAVVNTPEDERIEVIAAVNPQKVERNEFMDAVTEVEVEGNEVIAAVNPQEVERNEVMAAVNTPKVERNDVMAVVAVGQSRSGKSTALNNLFGTDFECKYSASSVTKEVITKRVIKGGRSIVVVDTPGMGSIDISIPKVKKKLEEAFGGLEFLLLYCYSVSPSNPKTLLDIQVMKNLKKTLGNDIWKKCVMLLTGCDMLRKDACQKESDRDAYKQHLNEHAQKLTDMLRKSCDPNIPNIKTVLELDLDDLPNEPTKEIIAVPVGIKRKEGAVKRERHVLVPGWRGNWMDAAYAVISHKAVPLRCKGDISITEGKIAATGLLAGIGIGAAVGAAVAGVVGAGAAGIGALPGAIIGAVGGSAVGAAIGGTSGGSVQKIKNKLHNNELGQKEERLRNAPIVPSTENNGTSTTNSVAAAATPTTTTQTQRQQTRSITRSRSAERPNSPPERSYSPQITQSLATRLSPDSDAPFHRSTSKEDVTADSQTSDDC